MIRRSSRPHLEAAECREPNRDTIPAICLRARTTSMARSWEAAVPASKISAPADECEHGEDASMFAMYTHLDDPIAGSASASGAGAEPRTKVRARDNLSLSVRMSLD